MRVDQNFINTIKDVFIIIFLINMRLNSLFKSNRLKVWMIIIVKPNSTIRRVRANLNNEEISNKKYCIDIGLGMLCGSIITSFKVKVVRVIHKVSSNSK